MIDMIVIIIVDGSNSGITVPLKVKVNVSTGDESFPKENP